MPSDALADGLGDSLDTALANGDADMDGSGDDAVGDGLMLSASSVAGAGEDGSSVACSLGCGDASSSTRVRGSRTGASDCTAPAVGEGLSVGTDIGSFVDETIGDGETSADGVSDGSMTALPTTSTHRSGTSRTVESTAAAGCAMSTKDANSTVVVATATTPEVRCVDMPVPAL